MKYLFLLFSLVFSHTLFGFPCDCDLARQVHESVEILPLVEYRDISLSHVDDFLSAEDTLPKWAEGDPEKVRQYYEAHSETWEDSIFGSLACALGVIIHGNITQPELAEQLNQFDVNSAVLNGPYHQSPLSFDAQQLIYDSLHHVNRVYDIHLHNLGYDEGNYLNPKISVSGVASKMDYFTFMVLRYASGMRSPIGSTQAARERIHLYVKHFPKLRAMILPIHKAILSDGTIDWANTGNFLKNHSALLTAQSFENDSLQSDILPAVSVHPFDSMWRQKLVDAHQKGIRLVKWMPPQSIQPDSDLIEDYYLTLKELDMTLIAHSGPEHAIPTTETNQEWQDWGNPLRFRKALQLGVNVILAHCGHKDHIQDLDNPESPPVQGYQLYFRLAREAYEKNLTGEWTGKLYGDLAAVTTHYGTDFIKNLLWQINEPGIRLIYGSDYPYTNIKRPGNDPYDLCAEAGLLDWDTVNPLKEIRNWNPLLANFVFTRTLRLVEPDGTILQFPEATFTGEFADGALNLMEEFVWQNYKADQNSYEGECP